MENIVYWLPALACPVGMGLMMWLMMRGNKGQSTGSMQMPAGNVQADGRPPDSTPDERLAQLRVQLDDVRAQQASIAAQIERLSSEDRPTEQRQAARTEPRP